MRQAMSSPSRANSSFTFSISLKGSVSVFFARSSTIPGQSGMLHAEINALLKMDYNNPKDKKMYLTLSPCRMCAKAIVNSGIGEVFYSELYRDDSSIKILEDAGIKHKLLQV